MNHRGLVVAALLLTGLSMRTAVTSIGPVLDTLQADLHVGNAAAGVLTTLPVVCFAALGSTVPRLARRVGEHRLLVGALALMTVGLALRALAPVSWLFLLLSVAALSGGAISNVVMPALVKAHFPDRISSMTALYTTALAVGTTAAAGLTVPISDLTGGWRGGIGSWAALSAVAMLPWLPLLRGPDTSAERAAALPVAALLRSRTAWALAVFFGTQSFQAYVGFGWYAKYLHLHGMSDGHAGFLVAFFAAVSIPVSMVMPLLATRSPRRLVLALGCCFLAGYIGLLAAPVGGAWVWMLLTGIGCGMFPLALTMIGLRTHDPAVTAAVSAFTQGIGYVIAGTGPLLFGVLYGATGSWAAPFTILFAVLALSFLSGLLAVRPRLVDAEVVLTR